MLPVAILAGGHATRLLPVTDTLPKALVPVAGRPFLLRQLDYLNNQGIREVVLCTGHRASQIEAVVGDGSSCGLDVQYSCDGDSLLGTGGAIRKALPELGAEFFVLYGDSFLPVDFGRVEDSYRANGQPGLMTVYRNAGQWDTSNVLFEEGKVVEYNKLTPRAEMQYIDYGLSILSAGVFDRYPPGEVFDLANLYHRLSISGQLAGHEVFERFYEIGSPAGLAQADQLFQNDGAMTRTYTEQHLHEARQILNRIDATVIESMAELLAGVKSVGGRLFFLGVGGSAGNCSHAVNDFRKIVGMEAYAPTDNVSELTARTNDEGWETVFVEWLKTSRLNDRDAVFVFSVGGGDLEKNVSPNLVKALQYAREVGTKITGIVGRDGGYTATVADVCVIVPTVNLETVTSHSEAFQAVVWHLLASHPRLKINQTKWESIP